MKVRVLDDNNALISGYVNVCERVSKQLFENGVTFFEKVKEGAFSEAISRNNNIKLLFNHDKSRELGCSSSNLRIFEDSIGLFAEAVVSDPEVVLKARNNGLSGWSFGFLPLKESVKESYSDDIPLRTVECLNLYEVSILDKEHIPAYNSMSLSVRGIGSEALQVRSFKDIEVDCKVDRELSAGFDNSLVVGKIDKFLDERELL